MDNQFVTDQEKSQQAGIRVAIALIALLLAALLTLLALHQFRRADPYVQNVLALRGDPAQGQAIFLMNCAGCHGGEAAGLVGPSLWGVSDRKSKVGLIEQVVSGRTPPMPQFQPSPQEMADLLSYLERL